MKKRIFNLCYKYLGILIFFIVWITVTASNKQIHTYIADPAETVKALISLIKAGLIFRDIAATLTRTILAFIPALICGVVLGILLGYFKRLRDIFEPIVEFFRCLPSTALLPVFVLFFGINDYARIATAFFIIIWIIVINTIYGVINIPKTRINVALCMKASKYETFKEVIMWEILPHIFSGMRLTISIGLVIIIISEMLIGAQYGLGSRLLEMQQTFKVDYLYAYIFVIGWLGFFLNKIILIVEKKIINWAN